MKLSKEVTAQLVADVKNCIDQGYTKSRKSPHHNLAAREAYSMLSAEEQELGAKEYKKDLEKYSE